jgi:hypothetical protein
VRAVPGVCAVLTTVIAAELSSLLDLTAASFVSAIHGPRSFRSVAPVLGRLQFSLPRGDGDGTVLKGRMSGFCAWIATTWVPPARSETP